MKQLLKQLSKQSLIGIVLIILIFFVITAVELFGFFYKKESRDISHENLSEMKGGTEIVSEDMKNTDRSKNTNWETFKSDEVYISFEYPKEWGGIIESIDNDLCSQESGTNSDEGVCRRVEFSTEKGNHIFLVTETKAYTQTLTNGLNGRGAAWYEKLRYQPESNYCDDNPYLPLDLKSEDCERFETKNNIQVTKTVHPVPFIDDQTMTIFFFQSTLPNTLYQEFVFSFVELEKEMDITGFNERKLIDSIIFF